MKRYLLFVAFLPLIGNAQIRLAEKDSLIKRGGEVTYVSSNANAETVPQTEWKKLGLDSVNFCKLYGSEFEYKYQKSIQWQSNHKFSALLIGAKYFYLNQLSLFMQSTEEYNVLDNNTNDFVFENKSYTEKNANIIIHPVLDKNERIRKVTITGPADDLIFLFVYYWNESTASLNKLKSHHAIVEDFGSDRINFSWIGVNPIINITQTPNLSYIPLSAKN